MLNKLFFGYKVVFPLIKMHGDTDLNIQEHMHALLEYILYLVSISMYMVIVRVTSTVLWRIRNLCEVEDLDTLNILLYKQYRGNISSRFSSNSEVSELLEKKKCY